MFHDIGIPPAPARPRCSQTPTIAMIPMRLLRLLAVSIALLTCCAVHAHGPALAHSDATAAAPRAQPDHAARDHTLSLIDKT